MASPNIDQDLQDYEPLPIREVKERLFAIGDGSVLRQPILHLIAVWEGAATAFHLPGLLVSHMTTMHSSPIGHELAPRAVFDRFCGLVDQSTAPLVLPFNRHALVRHLEERDRDLARTTSFRPRGGAFDAGRYWQRLTRDDSFRELVAKLMEMTYACLCFAFEDCVVTSLRHAAGASVPLESWKEVCSAAARLVPGAVVDRLRDPRIAVANLALMDLVHNGGRPGRKLGKLIASGAVPLGLHEGRINVMARAVRSLFLDLAAVVEALIPQLTTISPRQAGEASFGARMDNRMDVYRPFSHAAWRGELFDATRGSLVEPLAERLVSDFDHVSRAHQMPAFLPRRCYDVLVAMMRGDGGIARTFYGMLEGVVNDPRGPLAMLTERHRARLLGLLKDLEHGSEAESEKHSPEILREVWGRLATDRQFTMFTRTLCQMSYATLYFGYEAFATGCFRVVRADPAYRIPTVSEAGPSSVVDVPALARDHSSASPAREMLQSCFGDEPMVTAALVRDCIRHGGGRASERLREIRPRIEIIDGLLNIDAEDVRQLHVAIRKRALRLARGLAHLPSVHSQAGAIA